MHRRARGRRLDPEPHIELGTQKSCLLQGKAGEGEGEGFVSWSQRTNLGDEGEWVKLGFNLQGYRRKKKKKALRSGGGFPNRAANMCLQ